MPLHLSLQMRTQSSWYSYVKFWAEGLVKSRRNCEIIDVYCFRPKPPQKAKFWNWNYFPWDDLNHGDKTRAGQGSRMRRTSQELCPPNTFFLVMSEARRSSRATGGSDLSHSSDSTRSYQRTTPNTFQKSSILMWNLHSVKFTFCKYKV